MAYLKYDTFNNYVYVDFFAFVYVLIIYFSDIL